MWVMCGVILVIGGSVGKGVVSGEMMLDMMWGLVCIVLRLSCL